METLLAIRGLRKRFGAIAAVDDVSFEVPRGQVLGFLGPNGAGKSTTMRMVAGYLPPSAGSVTVCGFDVEKNPIEVRRRLGYLPEGAPAYGEMTPAGILRFAAETRGLGGTDLKRRTDEMVARLHLAPVLRQPIETLSKGFKRRVGLALALLHDPEVLILDEPTDGLDPNQKHEVRTLLADLAPRKAIIISTHILEEVDALCSRALVIARGRLVADARPAELLGRSAYHNAVALRLAPGHAEAARTALLDLDGVARIDTMANGQDGAELIVLPAGGRDILDAVRQRVGQTHLPVQQIHVERGRLDDVFRELTEAA
jgi:ABC-2 type transport system ATP-binding protein